MFKPCTIYLAIAVQLQILVNRIRGEYVSDVWHEMMGYASIPSICEQSILTGRCGSVTFGMANSVESLDYENIVFLWDKNLRQGAMNLTTEAYYYQPDITTQLAAETFFDFYTVKQRPFTHNVTYTTSQLSTDTVPTPANSHDTIRLVIDGIQLTTVVVISAIIFTAFLHAWSRIRQDALRVNRAQEFPVSDEDRMRCVRENLSAIFGHTSPANSVSFNKTPRIFVILLLTVMAHGLTLHDAIRIEPGYSDLTGCQQICIAGRLSWDPSTDYQSWGAQTNCATKACICGPEMQLAAEQFISDCEKSNPSSCGMPLSVTEYNGAISWVAGYCGWTPNLLAPTTSAPPSNPPPTPPPPPPPPPQNPPTSTSSTLSSGKTPTGSAQPSSTLSSNNIYQLQKCEPCGSSRCSFTNDSTLENEIYNLAVGSPVSNCSPGSNSVTTSKVGGTIMIGESWSDGTSIGLNWGALHVQGNIEWSTSKSISFSQEISIDIPSGQKGIMFATIKYKRGRGSMKVGSSSEFPLISNQPIEVMGYNSELVSCNSSFNANQSSPFNCTGTSSSSVHMWSTGTSKLYVLMPIILVVSLSMFL